MNVAVLRPASERRLRIARLGLTAAIAAWALFWTWFVVLVGIHDLTNLGPEVVPYAALALAVVWIPTVLAWRRPLAGAIGMAIAGLLALAVFRGPLLGGPPLAFALALFALARLQARGAR